MNSFVHLHTHSRMSVGDGLNDFSDIVKRVVDIGQEAIAITDHYYMYNMPEFYFEAVKAGIKPIIGCELGIYPEGVSASLPKDDLDDESTKSDQTVAYFHGVFLAKNYEGYQNLMKLASRGTNRDDRFYKKPRVTRADIRKYHKGLIFLSACVAGEIPKLILANKQHEALKTIAWYKKLFRNDFYLEIQDHGLPSQVKVNKVLIGWARKYKLNLVLTNDVHYTVKENAKFHSLLLCANWNQKFDSDESSVNSKYFPTQEFYIKTDDEMYEIAERLDCVDAYENSYRIMKKCNVVIPKTTHYPVAKLKLADNPDDELAMLVDKNKWEKYTDKGSYVLTATGEKIPKDVFDSRIAMELADIKTGTVADYFLNVAYGITDYCHENDIMIGAGRGSVAGSVVSYVLDITDVEPITLDLTWERFWNPGRMKFDEQGNILEISLPDIDLDIPSDRREEVMDHCAEYFGYDRVASIITFTTYSGKNLIDAVSKSIGFVESFNEENKGWETLKQIREYVRFGVADALGHNEDFKALYEKNKKVRNLIDLCLPIEGCVKNVSNHPAGIMIADASITEYTPYTYGKHGVTTQYSFEMLEAIGCLKVDLLGHMAEVNIVNACQYIEDNHGVKIIPREIPIDDKATFDMLSKCDTRGVPQIEKDWVLPIVRDVHPDALNHVIDLVTMIRPGSLDSGQTEKYRLIRNGKMSAKPDIPQVESITKDTYHCWLYQEQVMDVVKLVGGFTLQQADDLRKVVAKTKYKDKADKLMELFKTNSLSGKGAKGKLTTSQWEHLDKVIRDFFGYAFNKAHAAGYGVTSYRCAWLKANYFIEYMTALINGIDKKDLPFYLENIFEHGYDISLPDINVSGYTWTCENEILRPPLIIIEKCGPAAVEAIVEDRQLHGKFKSFEDFLMRTPSRAVKTDTIINLICVGAFVEMGYTRKTLYEAVTEDDYINKVRKSQGALFGKKGGLPRGGVELDLEEMQDDEENFMGFVISLTDSEKTERRDAIIKANRRWRGKIANEEPSNSSGRVFKNKQKSSVNGNKGDVADRLARKLAQRRDTQSKDDDTDEDDKPSTSSLERVKKSLGMRAVSKPKKELPERPADKSLDDVFVSVDTGDNKLVAKIFATLRRYVDDPCYRLVIIVNAKSKDMFKLETEFSFNKEGFRKLKVVMGDDCIWMD